MFTETVAVYLRAREKDQIMSLLEEEYGKAYAHAYIHLLVRSGAISTEIGRCLVVELNKTTDSWETAWYLSGGSPLTVGEMTPNVEDCWPECFGNEIWRYDCAMLEVPEGY